MLVDPAGPPRPGQRDHIASLTGLRGFAALTVVAVHAAGQTNFPWFGLHTYGPIALFTLSGFLLFQPWSKWMLARSGRPSVRSFARRRALRIFPAYLVTLFVVAVIFPPSRPQGLDGWVRALFLAQTTSPTGLRPGMEHVWSLGTELTWYLALPVLGGLAAWLVIKRGVRPLTAMMLLLSLSLATTVFWRYYVAVHVTDLNGKLTMNFWLPGFLVCFVAGGLISHLVLMRRYELASRRPLEWFADRPWLVLVTAVVAAGIANSSLGGGWGWVIHTPSERAIRFAFTTLFALILLAGVAAVSRPNFVTALFASRPMVAIGRWSYGVYLWHLAARELLLDHMTVPAGLAGLMVWFALQLAIAIPLGALTYAFIERPAIAWSRRPSRRQTAAQQPS